MSYAVHGRQFVAVAATGDNAFGKGDELVLLSQLAQGMGRR